MRNGEEQERGQARLIGREVFIIRFWPGEGGEDSWRSVVEHVRTGRSIPLHSLDELMTFIETHFPPLAAPPGLR